MSLTISLITNLIFYGFTLWLGAYLIARNSLKMTVRLTGIGVVFYAIVLAFEIIWGQQPTGLLLIPALFWIGAAIFTTPPQVICWLSSIRSITLRWWASQGLL